MSNYKIADSQIVCDILQLIQFIPKSTDSILSRFSEVNHSRVISIIDNMSASRIIANELGCWKITLGNGNVSDQYEYLRKTRYNEDVKARPINQIEQYETTPKEIQNTSVTDGISKENES